MGAIGSDPARRSSQKLARRSRPQGLTVVSRLARSSHPARVAARTRASCAQPRGRATLRIGLESDRPDVVHLGALR